MLKDQKPVIQKFNGTNSIIKFNKKNTPQVDGFIRKKSFDAPNVNSKRGDIFAQNKQTKNKLKPTLYVNNSTRKTTSADLANVRQSFRKSNPVRYYSDFTIISAIENAHKSGKYHFDVSNIERLKEYLNYNDKEPNKNVDNIPDVIPTPKIIPYTPNDTPIPTTTVPPEMLDNDPAILPKSSSNWKSKLKTAGKVTAGILTALAAAGIAAYYYKGHIRLRNKRNREIRRANDVINEYGDDDLPEYMDENQIPENNELNDYGDDNLPEYMDDLGNFDGALEASLDDGVRSVYMRPPEQNPDFDDGAGIFDDAELENILGIRPPEQNPYFAGDNETLENILGRPPEQNPYFEAYEDIETLDDSEFETLDDSEFETLDEEVDVEHKSVTPPIQADELDDIARARMINSTKSYQDKDYFNLEKIRRGIHDDINNNPEFTNEEKMEMTKKWLNRNGRLLREEILKYRNLDGIDIVQMLWQEKKALTPIKEMKKPASKNPKTPKKPKTPSDDLLEKKEQRAKRPKKAPIRFE